MIVNSRNHSIDSLSPQQKRDLLKRLMAQKNDTGSTDHPLSDGQKSLWLTWQIVPESPAYNVFYALRIRSAVEADVLQKACQALVDRHSVLRTSYPLKDGEPMQRVQAHQPVSFEQTDAVHWSADTLYDAVQTFCQRPFDLEQGPAIRFHLFHDGAEDHVLALSIHHIACDGWSMAILFEELGVLYTACLDSHSKDRQLSALPPVPSHVDFIRHQQAQLSGAKGEQLWQFWRNQLAGQLPVLSLPTDSPRPQVQTYHGHTHLIRLDRTRTQRIKTLAQREGVIPFVALLSAYYVLLHRYSGDEDILVGAPMRGRICAEFSNVIGYFVNQVVVRADLAGDPSFTEFLGRVKDRVLSALAHQDLPFQTLLNRLQPSRDPSRPPLFSTSFVYQKPQGDSAMTELLMSGEGDEAVTSQWAGLAVESYSLPQIAAWYDLTVDVMEVNDQLLTHFRYNTDLFRQETIERMANHFLSLIDAVTEQPEQRLSELALLTDHERQTLLYDWNRIEPQPEVSQCLHQVFEQQAVRAPQAIAVSCDGDALSYAELNEQANRLAHYLIALGVGPESRVALSVARGLPLAVGLLAILKSGAAYVPLDPAYPAERLSFLLADSQPQVLLAQHDWVANVGPLPATLALIELDGDADLWAGLSTENPAVSVTPANLAYIIYTSGSTGQPKGVMVEHRQVTRLFRATSTWLTFGPDDVWSLFHSYAFDFSVWEIWGAWLHGGHLVVVPTLTAKSPDAFYQLLCDQAVTVLNQTPSAFRPLIRAQAHSEQAHRLRYVLFGGEALDVATLAPWYAHNDADRTQLCNLYGITETTVHVTCRPLTPEDSERYGVSPIGQRLPDLRTYLLDAHKEPVPIGVTGELYVGGAGVARGYFNRPALTEERFLADPFVADPDARLYRTGDLGRWQADGTLMYLGRNDEQVKLRGFRIEPGEIATRLQDCAGVGDVAVVIREDTPDDPRLVAYLTTDSTSVPQQQQVAGWQQVFDRMYTDTADENTLADFSGWDSSYTGDAIPLDQMQQWQADTLSRLRALSPSRVLEIGCGSGLLLLELAVECQHYVGTDFSQETLARLQRKVDHLGLSHVQLAFAEADQLDTWANGGFDTVIINSVIQYFPDSDYLQRVIDGAMQALAPHGRLLIGDVRHLGLLDAFHATVLSAQAEPGTPVSALRTRVQQAAAMDNELLVAPAYFVAQRHRHARLGRIDLLPKAGHIDNELSCYRYDAILHLETEVKPYHGVVERWNARHHGPSALAAYLNTTAPAELVLTGIANARTEAEARLCEALAEGETGTLAELQHRLSGKVSDTLHPQTLMDLAHAAGYGITLSWLASGNRGAYHAYLKRGAVDDATLAFPENILPVTLVDETDALTNTPRAQTQAAELRQSLHAMLSAQLPEYMLPSAYVILPSLPLTPNGKLDRRALPAPEGEVHSRRPYEAPQGPVEIALANLWAPLLNVREVSRHDQFFELGGHSLLAVTLIERMKAEGLPADVQTLFTRPVLKDLAAALTETTVVEVDIPDNLITGHGTRISPDQLPLVTLTQAEIDRIVHTVPGGVANVQDIYPLTPLQSGILFHHLLAGQGDAYRLPFVLAFDDRHQRSAFLEALHVVIQRHDILRTSVCWQSLAEPVQVVWRQAPLSVETVTLAGADIAAELRGHLNQPLDLTQAPLMRAWITEDPANQRSLLGLLNHHLAIDHTTLDGIVREVRQILAGATDSLPRPLPFRRFVAQARLGVSEADHTTYFQRLLATVDEPTAPYDVLDTQGDGNAIVQARHRLSSELAGQLRRQARRQGVSVASLCHLAWGRVLSVLSGKSDVVFGTVLFGRLQGESGSDRALGMLINTLPVRLLLGNRPLDEAVRDTHQQLSELLRHEHAPLTLAQQCSAVASPLPLFTSLLNYRYSPDLAKESDQASWEGMEVLYAEDFSNYPLSMDIDDDGDGFTLGAQVQKSIDPVRICGYMQAALTSLTAALKSSPAIKVHQLNVLPSAERQLLLHDWNGTTTEWPTQYYVHERFEQQAASQPDGIAVSSAGQSLTYQALNAQANRLAHYLISLGVGPDTCVAIGVERGLDMLVGLLAILKAGGAYVPLDPAYPEERLAGMLADSAPQVLLTQRSLASRWGNRPDGLAVLVLDSTQPEWADQSEQNPDPRQIGLRPDHLAYVIYTSGSTGQPKGVMIEHKALSHQVEALQQMYSLDHHSRILQFASFAFDMSVEEIFPALSCGGQLVLRNDEWLAGAEPFWHMCAVHGLSHLNLPAAFWQQLVQEDDIAVPTTIRQISVGGDAISVAHLKRWFASDRPKPQLFNAYGPTETTVNATMQTLTDDPDSWASIGRPLINTRAYILDAQQQLVPVGVTGELHIAGVHVARGYLNQPELTAEHFPQDPYYVDSHTNQDRHVNVDTQPRMYRTGDLARWRADGTIEFLGRSDFQVKIRGFRIEPGEIEAQMHDIDGIQDAVVLAREDGTGEKILVAYYLGSEHIAIDALRDQLGKNMPAYMLPSACVRLDAWPETPNGKLNRNALPAPDASAFRVREYSALVGEAEQVLAEIWSELLGVETVGRHDHFFELGGHSLTAMTLVSRLQTRLDAVLPLPDIFANPQLCDMASMLDTSDSHALPPITIADRSQGVPLSFAQQRLWFLDRLESRASQAYHMAGRIRLTGELDGRALQFALDGIISRHEILRTTFQQQGDNPVQVIAPASAGLEIKVHDLTGIPETESDAMLEQRVEDAIASPFELSTGPLIRACLIRQSATEHTLLVVMHHIISDGWSEGVLIDELSALYQMYHRGEENPLSPLPVQYADYAVWQRQWLTNDILQTQRDYWVKQLTGAPALLELPTDHPRPAQQDYAGQTIPVRLDAELTRQLQSFSRKQGVTLYMTLLASWSVLLSRLSGQDDVVIGTPVANRHRTEIEPMIGLFVNTLALRIDLSDSPTVTELLAQVKNQSLAAQSHQDMPFEQVVEALNPPRSLAHSPIFQVMFAWQNMPVGQLWMDNLALEAVETPAMNIPCDVMLSLQETGDVITGSLLFASALFERESMQRYLEHWQTLLRAMITADQQPVDQLNLLNDTDRQRILNHWSITTANRPPQCCVHELFEQQVRAQPEAIAVVHESNHLSYAELNRQANRLANYLISLGVGPDVPVAIGVERGLDMMVGLLAILKAGGAYVPLEPSYPAKRLSRMLADSAPHVLLTQSTLKSLWSDLPENLPVIALDDDDARWSGLSDQNPALDLAPSQLAYVIYTSGSTGRPKGVSVEHQGLTNLFTAMIHEPGLTAEDILVAITTVGFDASGTELWWPLLAGARLVIASRDCAADGAQLNALLQRSGATVLQATPATWRLLLAAGWTGSQQFKALCGGEAFPLDLIKALYERTGSLWNMYGPTEATIWSNAQRITSPEIATGIGRPIANNRLYLLDANRQPVPVGVIGEIHIGGVQVAREYLNRHELTEERFLQDPFVSSDQNQPAPRMYRTGDLGRWRTDGTVEFLGRRDFQMKVRGFRIEAGEVEACLSTIDGIDETILLAREDVPGDQRLVAYYTGADDLRSDILRQRLARDLPAYMVPSAYVRLEAMPLTPNGKLDRQSLPVPSSDMTPLHTDQDVPQGVVETQLARLWCELLRVDRIGRHDHFFESGGHSLLAVQLVSRLAQEGIAIDVAALFTNPTILQLAMYIARDWPTAQHHGTVPVRAGGSAPPLFLVHDGLGEVLYAHALAGWLDADIPVYGLPGDALAEQPLHTIPAQARRFVEMIIAVQPHGPYRIAGWSYGGVLAYEIATQLIGEDKPVEFVGLFDSEWGNRQEGQRIRQQSDSEIVLAIAQQKVVDPAIIDQLTRLAYHDSFDALVRACQQVLALPEGLSLEAIQRYIVHHRIYIAAMHDYVMSPLPLPVHYFKAEDEPGEVIQSDVQSGQGFQVINVPGSHQSMMDAPNIEILGKALTDTLAAVRDWHS